MSVRLSDKIAGGLRTIEFGRMVRFTGFQVLLMGVLLSVGGSTRAAVLRVDLAATASEDGLSWATAYRTIPAALSAAVAGDELWVAKGRYIGAVVLKSSVHLFGGFAATETTRDGRNPAANETVLDGGGPTGSVNNVVTVNGASAQTVLDGFVVEGGLVDGLYSISSSVRVVGCRFQKNGDDGVDVDFGAPVVSNCTITMNGDDGLDCDNASPAITGCTVSENAHDGLQLNGSSAVVTQNSITGNGDDGINCDSGRPRIMANAISDNGDDGIDANFSGVEIRGNLLTDNSGDGIYCFTASPGITGNQVRDNGDDGIDCYISEATIADNLIAGNGTGPGNNGIECYLSRPTIRNNTIVENADHGIVLLNSALTAVNNIVAFHTHGLTALDAGSSAILRNNCVYSPQGTSYTGLTNPTGTGGNLGVDPLFANRQAGDYHLSANSPCLNAGDDTVVLNGETDIDGEARILGPHVDIGADERVVAAGFVLADVVEALRVAGGLSAHNGGASERLDVELLAGHLTLGDAQRLVRKAAGTDPNP